MEFVPFSLASFRLFSSRSSLLRRVLCCCSAWSYTSVGSRVGHWGKTLIGDPALLVPLSSPKGAVRGKESLCLFRMLWLNFSSSVWKVLGSTRPDVLGGRLLSVHSGLVNPGGGRLGGKGGSYARRVCEGELMRDTGFQRVVGGLGGVGLGEMRGGGAPRWWGSSLLFKSWWREWGLCAVKPSRVSQYEHKMAPFYNIFVQEAEQSGLSF